MRPLVRFQLAPRKPCSGPHCGVFIRRRRLCVVVLTASLPLREGHRVSCRREGTEVGPIPETRYAQAVDGGQVAYQVAGSGPTLMLGFNALAGIDVMREEPRFVRFLDRLSSFTRHAWFDPRNQGSSS